MPAPVSRSLVATALTATVVASAAALAPAQAARPRQAPVTLVTAGDPAGDVWLNPRVHDVPARQARTIDLRSISVERRGTVVRFTVHIKKLVSGKRWDQMAFFTTTPADGSDDWQGDIGLSPQMPKAAYGSMYYTADGGTYVNCDPLRSRSRAVRHIFWVDVPRRCVPSDPAKLKVTTYAAIYRGDGIPIAKDVLAVPGSTTLR